MNKLALFIFFLPLFIFFLPLFAFSQTETISLKDTGLFPDSLTTSAEGKGQVLITEDSRLTQILHNYSLAFRKHKIKGWRIQIYFGSDVNASQKAKSIVNKFKTEYPDVSAYIEYHEPYFKVRVGDFLTRLEAAKFKFILEQNGYKNIFLVEEEINIK